MKGFLQSSEFLLHARTSASINSLKVVQSKGAFKHNDTALCRVLGQMETLSKSYHKLNDPKLTPLLNSTGNLSRRNASRTHWNSKELILLNKNIRSYSMKSHFTGTFYKMQFVRERFSRAFHEIIKILQGNLPHEEKIRQLEIQYLLFQQSIKMMIRLEEVGWHIPSHKKISITHHHTKTTANHENNSASQHKQEGVQREHQSEKHHLEDELLNHVANSKKHKYYHVLLMKLLHNCERAIRECKHIHNMQATESQLKSTEKLKEELDTLYQSLEDHFNVELTELFPLVEHHIGPDSMQELRKTCMEHIERGSTLNQLQDTALTEKMRLKPSEEENEPYEKKVQEIEQTIRQQFHSSLKDKDKESQIPLIDSIPFQYQFSIHNFRLCEMMLREVLNFLKSERQYQVSHTSDHLVLDEKEGIDIIRHVRNALVSEKDAWTFLEKRVPELMLDESLYEPL